ncbi:MAG: hypothetical protein ACQEW8_04560 [Actinomycetota bacterium]
MRRRLPSLDLGGLRGGVGLTLLWLFLLVDIVLLALHLAHTLLGVPGGSAFDLGVDRSYSEMLMYVKFGWIGVLAVLLARRREAPVFAALALVSLVLLLEDSLILHERIGWFLTERVTDLIPAIDGLGILSVQIGELLWLGAIGVVILIVFVLTYRRARPRDRTDALSIAAFFAVLAFFAVVVDTVHSLFAFGSAGDIVFTVLEDGGEMMALTPAVALAFALVHASDRGAGDGPSVEGDVGDRLVRAEAAPPRVA